MRRAKLLKPIFQQNKKIQHGAKAFSTRTALLQQNQSSTHFGYKTVPEQEKQKMVNEVFEKVASKYDVMNDFMSAGLHRLWKDSMINALKPQAGTNLLDVAGGTGDIAFRIVEQLKSTPHYGATSTVTVCDINPAMLAVGKERARKLGYLNDNTNLNLQFLEGNAEILADIPDESQDAYTIAFGIRNVTHIDKALEQAYRVLKKGGQFLCLEFSQVENPALRAMYDLYSFNVIPTMGTLVAGDKDSYQYLVESIRKFPNQEKFKSMMQQVGFKQVRYTNMTFGVVALHQGFKL